MPDQWPEVASKEQLAGRFEYPQSGTYPTGRERGDA